MTWIEYCILNDVSQFDTDMRFRRSYFSALARFLFTNKMKKKKLWQNVRVNGLD